MKGLGAEGDLGWGAWALGRGHVRWGSEVSGKLGRVVGALGGLDGCSDGHLNIRLDGHSNIRRTSSNLVPLPNSVADL